MIPAPTILVLNHLAERHITAIKNVVPDANVICADLAHAAEYMADVDILVAWGWMNIRSLYLAAPKLKWVHTLSAVVERLNFPEIQQSTTILTNSRTIHGIHVSEHVFALLLAFTRGLNLIIHNQTEKRWKRVPTEEIHEKTIGIIGLGSIGREIAKKAKGLGMNVLAVKRQMTNELFVDQLYTPDQLHDMLPECDFVVLSLPLLEETRGLFGLEQFKMMKKSTYFINISRGEIVKEADLIAALQAGEIQGAGLDVFETEPLPTTSPLWDMPNVIITPHIAALSPAYLDRAIKLFVDNLVRFANGGEMFNVIDKTKGY
jgi:phosphoglycerate dehydrogenase-like enzyme